MHPNTVWFSELETIRSARNHLISAILTAFYTKGSFFHLERGDSDIRV